MKIAVFTDIHGNIEALRTVICSIRRQKVDKVIFLGDVFFRGTNVRECIDLLIAENVTCLAGNCELYFADGVDIDSDVLKDKQYYDTIREILPDKYFLWVKSLPLKFELTLCEKKLLFSHFLIKDQNAPYPFYSLSSIKDGTLFEKATRQDYDYMFFGHSHRKFAEGNVISIPAAGIDEAEYLLIEAEDTITFRFIRIGFDDEE